jgi:hypothetical protein
MNRQFDAEHRNLTKRIRKWSFVALGCSLYLLADWIVLVTMQSGGYLGRSFISFIPQSLAVLEYRESAEGNYVIINEQSGNYFTSRAIYSPETIVIYYNPYAPFWAPTRRPLPKAIYADQINKTQLPADILERTVEAASLISVDEAERLKQLLLITNQPAETLWLGRIRNIIAISMLLIIVISGILMLGIIARIRTVNRSLKLSRCTCGYDLVGLTTEICPECGRATLPPKPGQSSTMDA